MMLRRSVFSLLGGFAVWLGSSPAGAQSAASAGDARLNPNSPPLPVAAVRGVDALTTWEQLRAKGEGWPIILGDARRDAWLAEALEIDKRSVDEILTVADGLTFPASLVEWNRSDDESLAEALKAYSPDAVAYRLLEPNVGGEEGSRVLPPDSEEGRPVTFGELLREGEASDQPPLGEWPARPEVGSGPTGYIDFETGRVAETVHIVVLPTSDPTAVPAHLRLGGWNACPPAEHHVAVLRALRDRYGAEIVVCTSDTVELRVQRRPETREEAITLARDLYLYCNDSIDQGLGTVSDFAAYLMASEWWLFWWD